MRTNNIYSTQTGANEIVICTFLRFNKKWLRNDKELTDWEQDFVKQYLPANLSSHSILSCPVHFSCMAIWLMLGFNHRPIGPWFQPLISQNLYLFFTLYITNFISSFDHRYNINLSGLFSADTSDFVKGFSQKPPWF